jgi:hypothetical protein
LADKDVVSRFWQDAAGIFETASSVTDGSPANLAILVDERNGLRIVDSAGWTLDALRREYQASTAYTVQRTGHSVVVEAQNSAGSCTFRKSLPVSALTNLGGFIPQHLLQPSLLT